ncbi:hypothetical protein Tco_1404966 [Tanacetum coccineum]
MDRLSTGHRYQLLMALWSSTWNTLYSTISIMEHSQLCIISDMCEIGKTHLCSQIRTYRGVVGGWEDSVNRSSVTDRILADRSVCCVLMRIRVSWLTSDRHCSDVSGWDRVAEVGLEKEVLIRDVGMRKYIVLDDDEDGYNCIRTGVAVDSLEYLKQTHAGETAKLAALTDAIAESLVGILEKEHHVAKMNLND